jgi:hypothetical protein
MKSGRLLLLLIVFSSFKAVCQQDKKVKSMVIYGYVMTDIGYNFNQINPVWYDVLKVSELPQYKDQFAPDGKVFFSVRQTRLGVQSMSPTPWGTLKSTFEFDLFGSGANVGETTFHFRQAFVELGKFLVGETYNLFTDVNVSPDILDFGAPPARVNLRNIQIRYTPIEGKTRLAIALERPGATADEGIYANRVELQNVRSELTLPDFSVESHRDFKNGYLELAGLLKWIKWKDTGNGTTDLGGHTVGWGLNLSSNYNLSPDNLFRGQVVYGKAIGSNLTDAPVDIGLKNNLSNPIKPVLGVPIPVFGVVAFLEHRWNTQLSSTMGYSSVHLYNSDAQAANAFKKGRYGILNILYSPFSDYMMGAELQWGKRINFNDGFSSSIVKVQFSFKYSFNQSLLGNKR